MNLQLGVKLCSQLLCGLSLATLLTAPATAQTLSWKRQLGTSASDISSNVATDTLGNVYISGSTRGALAGANQGYSDAWVAKYDTTGKLLWLRQLGSPDDDRSSDVAVDTLGNVYISGSTFGALAGASQGGLYDAWVAKYDPSGKLLWLRQLGTSKYDFSYGIATDTSGNVYISGSTAGALTGANRGEYDAWVAKFNTSGKLLWLRQLGSSALDNSNSVAVDTLGNVYISGSTRGALVGANQGYSDAWVAKYDTTGKLLWLRQLGSPDDDISYGVAVDTLSDVYISGSTSGAVAGIFPGYSDAWVAKYDPSGKLLWRRQLGISDLDYSYSVAVDTSDHVYISGYTRGAIAGALQRSTEAWVAKYDTNGILVWKRQLGSFSGDTSNGVAVDTLDNVYISGYTAGALAGDFQGGLNDAWVAKFTQK